MSGDKIRDSYVRAERKPWEVDPTKGIPQDWQVYNQPQKQTPYMHQKQIR